MAWGKLDDSSSDHPKFVALSEVLPRPLEALAAIGLWDRGLAWAAKHGTDGRIPRSMVPVLARLRPALAFKLADALVTVRGITAVGLWEARPDGYQIHDWLDWNPSAADVVLLRANRRLSGQLGGMRSAEARREAFGSAQPEAHASMNRNSWHHDSPKQTPKHLLPKPPNPDPTRPSTTEQVAGTAVRGDAGARAGSVSEPPGAAIPGETNGPNAPDLDARKDAALRMLSAATGLSVEQLRAEALARRAAELKPGGQP